MCIKEFKLCNNLNQTKIGTWQSRNLIFWFKTENFPLFQLKKLLIEPLRLSCGNCRIYLNRYSAKSKWPILSNLSRNTSKTMMVFTKDRCAMAKSTDLENISIKMETYTMAKCTKAWCKGKENIPGQIKMSTKGHLSKIRWVDSENLYSPMEMSTKDNLSITGHVETAKWSLILEMLIKANLWTI
jgi:hypothetical protein